MFTVLALALIWLAGAVATNAITRRMGIANPDTIFDSFSGDDMLDLAIIVLWPLFWPLWAVHRLAEIAYDKAR